MPKINLLPWRDELRAQRRNQFYMAMGGAFGVYADLKKEYLDFCRLVEKSKYKTKNLTLGELLFLVKRFKSYKNELSGKTVKYNL